MRILRIASVLGILCGLVFLHVAHTLGSENNWCPVSLPFPSPGIAVATPFHVESSGNLRVEVSSPIESGKAALALPAISPMTCDLALLITNDEGFSLVRRISTLSHVGRSTPCGLDYYADAPVELPARGDYSLAISNRTGTGTTSPRGAMIRFTRFERPVESALRYPMLEVASYVIVVLSAFVLMMSTGRAKARRGDTR